MKQNVHRHLWLYTFNLEEILKVAWEVEIYKATIKGVKNANKVLMRRDVGLGDDDSVHGRLCTATLGSYGIIKRQIYANHFSPIMTFLYDKLGAR